eukprot:GHRQ01016708.1.p1 GENE.GHRQ01016708.1~~GHRQ01016708.1.p1  ORF type:complete len:240 (+),score=28.06 GHRQ01016708.1:670-1389(+)
MLWRASAAALLVLLLPGLAHASRASLAPTQQGRQLSQTRALNCSKINPHCAVCRNQRNHGTRASVLVCSSCDTGYKLRRDGLSKTCDCAPGFAMDVNKACVPCTLGKYCPGGDPSDNPNNLEFSCSSGLQTTMAGAKSEAQCFTLPGYGRVSMRGDDGSVYQTSVLCPIGTYNVGSNTAGCQYCGPGLTTATNGSTSNAACREFGLVVRRALGEGLSMPTCSCCSRAAAAASTVLLPCR